jgi:hypothetical protein
MICRLGTIGICYVFLFYGVLSTLLMNLEYVGIVDHVALVIHVTVLYLIINDV